VKVVADFETLRLCDVILGVASSAYANMAVAFSLNLNRHVDPSQFCSLRERRRFGVHGAGRGSWLRQFHHCALQFNVTARADPGTQTSG